MLEDKKREIRSSLPDKYKRNVFRLNALACVFYRVIVWEILDDKFDKNSKVLVWLKWLLEERLIEREL